MATRTKTVIYAFPALASLTNNTLTTLTQITLYLPESSKTFRSVTAHVSFDDIVTATGGTLTTKTQNLRLGAASYTSVTNSGALTNTGENASFILSANYTSHFTTNWSGTSMTCDFQLQINQSTGTTLGMVNVCVTLEITYDYDDTSTTHVKTVIIPLDAPDGALTTGATTYDTMPALAYYCAEAGKTFRGIYLVVEGNEHRNGATTDHTMTLYAGTANVTTGNYEGALASDRRFRYVWDATSAWPDTTATQVFQALSSVARVNHFCAYLIVTYEFEADNTSTTLTEDLDNSETGIDVTAAANLGTVPFVISVDNEQMLVTSIASNTLTVTRGYNSTTAATHTNGATVKNCITNSVQLCGTPLEIVASIASTEHARSTAQLYIAEPGPITAAKVAAYLFWTQSASLSTFLNVRLGTGSFIGKTDAASVLCGGNSCMERNDSAFALARGKNTLNVDAYISSGSNYAHGMNARFDVAYVSSQPAAGPGAANHTIRRNILTAGALAGGQRWMSSSTAVEIAEAGYLASNLGTEGRIQFTSTPPSWYQCLVERLSTGGEGGLAYVASIGTTLQTDSEIGWAVFYGSLDSLGKHWPEQTHGDRVSLETARKYLQNVGALCYSNLAVWVTYHAVGPFTIDGDISNSNGGTVNIYAHRKSDGELLKSTSRSGDGAYSMDWWDNTETLFVEAFESSSYVGRSEDAVANGAA